MVRTNIAALQEMRGSLSVIAVAACLFTACTSGERQRLQLEKLERMNRADSLMLNDSLARDLADWFDRHGTRNEQLRAYYMLGRTYADRGEVPQALEAYHDAIDRADTTAQDCNYYTLCRVYAQMSDILYYQNLFEDNLRCLKLSVRYALKANDSITAVNSYAHQLGAYDRYQMTDSIISISEATYRKFCQMGMANIASQYCALAIDAYARKKMYDKARFYMEVYEKESGYFDTLGNIERGREAYYDIKGRYYLSANELDSAEYFFRKELRDGVDYNNQNMASLGLAQVYQQKRIPDSVAKYSLYSYAMKDSILNQQITTEAIHIQAMYDYSTHQHIAQQEKERADYERNKATSYLFILVLIVAIGGYIVYLQIKRRQAADTAYQNKVSELERVQNDVLLLRSQEEDKNAVLREKEEEMTNLQKELSVLRGKIEQISESTESQLLKNVGYKHLTDIAEAGKLMTEEDWRDVNKLVIDVLPEFSQYISNQKHSLNIVEYRTAILFRLHIRSKSIHYMLGISPQYV